MLLRRNRVALLFPSPAAITAPFTAKLDASRAECVRELVADILPVFDAFPSASFASAVARDVTDSAADAQVAESLVALARHCVRMGMRAPRTGPTSSGSETPDLALTRALLRLSKLLGSETEFHDHVLRDLVEHLFPFDAAATASSAPSPSKRRPSYDASDMSDEDASMDGSSDASSSVDRVTSAALSSSRHLFGSCAMAFACAQVASRTIDAMCTQTLRVVLFLSHLADAQPAFLSAAIVRTITRSLLPRAIVIYQRWRLSKWLASQNLTHAAAIESDAYATRASTATLLPPLLQLFLIDANVKLNATSALKRARSVLDLARVTQAAQSEEAQNVLASFAREILRLVATPSEPLVRFLQQRKQFALVRALVSCSLRDISLSPAHYSATAAGKTERADAQHAAVQRAVQSIGECLAREGHAAAASAALSAASDREVQAHARWCFEQAVRCFRIGLSSYLSDHDEPSRLDRAAERFVYDTIGLLKETAPRAHADLVLDFLWTVVTQALTRSGESDGALQTFVWVNVFKCSVERQRFRDAHVALMHTLDASAGLDVGGAAARGREHAPLTTATECVTYFVNELCRYGQLDLVCDLEWGALASDVETHLQWQAANANVVSAADGSSSVDAAVLTYHQLLYAYYMRRQEPANAAAAMHALYLRLRLAPLKARSALEAQRNALNTAQTALLALPAANRWIVRKYHGEELLVSARSSRVAAESTTTKSVDRLPLDIVTLADMTRDLAVLDGKLQLLHLGRCDESVLLSTMDGDDVVALLVDAAIAVCEQSTRTTLAKERESSLALELALAIATKSASQRFSPITKSLARYCVSVAHRVGIESLCWRLLEDVLAALDRDCERASLAQYEVAAATILDWHVKIVLPPWLVARLGDRKGGNPSKLLQLYLQHGLLRDALQLADAMVPDELLSESEARFQQRVAAQSAALPWLPYTLFDALLDAVDTAVRASSSSSARALQDDAQQFRAKLTSYFKYIALLEDARAAMIVAQSAVTSSSGGFGFGASARTAGAL